MHNLRLFVIVWCLLLAGVAWGAPPIEALMRSAQSRFEAVSYTGTTVPQWVFPKRYNTDVAPAYPPDGFYGSDLDDANRLSNLISSIEGLLGSTEMKYYGLSMELEGTTRGLAAGGVTAPSVYQYMSPVVSVLPPLSYVDPVDQRIERIKDILTLMKTAIILVKPVRYQRTKNGETSGAVIIAILANSPCGSAYGAAVDYWIAGYWRTTAGSTWPSAYCRNIMAGSNSYVELYSTGGYARWNLGNAQGEMKYYLVASGALESHCPVAPDGKWREFDTKSGTGEVRSREAITTPPPLVDCEDLKRWDVSTGIGVFTGQFQDDWKDDECDSCTRCDEVTIDDEGSYGGYSPAGSGASPLGGSGGVSVNLSLGGGNYGDASNSVSLKANKPSATLASPSALRFRLASGSEVIRNAAGIPVQVATQTSLSHVSIISPNKYQIADYSAPTAPKQGDGTYPVSGSASKVTTIENPPSAGNPSIPDLNVIKVTIQKGTHTQVAVYTYTPATDTWQLAKGDGTYNEVVTKSWTVGQTDLLVQRTITNASGAVVSKVEKMYHVYPWGKSLTSETIDPDGVAQTTTYSYNATSGLLGYGGLQQWVRSSRYWNAGTEQWVTVNGNWERYEYDSKRRIAKIISQLDDQPVGAAENVSRVRSFDYTGTSPFRVVESEFTLGSTTAIAKRFTVYGLNTLEERVAVKPAAAYNDATNLVTLSKSYSGANAGRLKSVRRPDGTLTTYSYTKAVDGSTLTTITCSGAPNGAGDTVISGTQSTVVVDRGGNQISRTDIDIASGLLLTSATGSEPDEFGRRTKVTFEDGTFQTDIEGCCGPQTSTDRTGAVTTYEHDELGHQSEVTRDGVTTISELDPLGRVLVTKRRGTDGTIQTISETEYDVAGRPVLSKDAAGRITNSSVVVGANGQTTRTITHPDAGTEIQVILQDGRPISVSGTATAPKAYEYGFEDNVATSVNGVNVSIRAAFTKEIRVGEGGATTEWTKSYTDMAGRPCKVVQSNGGETVYAYNLAGQLSRLVDPDMVATLFTYNTRGEQEKVVLDLNRNGSIESTGTDRITETVRSVVSANGPVVQRTVTSQWSADGAATTVTSQVDVTPNGRQSWQTFDGQPPASSATVLNGNGGTTTTTTFPDGSVQVEQRENGRPILVSRSSVDTGTIQKTTYTYDDPFRRLTKMKDERNGDTSMTYWPDDQLKSVTTPPPGDGSPAQTTLFFYDSAGRRARVVEPDGGQVRSEFWPNGQLKSTQGVRTYPVEYTYDPQGRMRTMTTQGAAGPAVTTWEYDPTTGWLKEKRYAGEGVSATPDYEYSQAGRLTQRTWERGVVTTYGLNNAGEVGSITYTGGTVPTTPVSITYDRMGRPNGMTDDSGVRGWANTPAGRPGTETYSSGMFENVSVTRSYVDSRLQSIGTNVGGTINGSTLGYDGASRLKTVTSGDLVATYSYAPNSSLISQLAYTKDNNQAVMTATRTYDNLNRLQNIQSTIAGQPTPTAGMSYGYNQVNQRTSATSVDQSSWQYNYDALGQVTSGSKRWSDGTPVAGQQFGYEFDQIGNRTTTTTNGRVSTYAPNLLNQYADRTVPGAVDILGTAASDVTVTVNNQPVTRQGNYFATALAVSNASAPVDLAVSATGVTPNGSGTQDLTLNTTGNQFVAKTPEVFTYDVDGNLTGDGRWIYTWDGENRLVAMEAQATVPAARKLKLVFKYDGFNRRVQKEVYNWNSESNAYILVKTVRFLYDGWNLLVETSASNQVQRAFVWGCDLGGTMYGAGGVGGLLAQYDTSACRLPGYDANGNVLFLMSVIDGAVDARYEYGVFGEALSLTGQLATINPIRFSTKYTDDETGLIYYGYRMYAPQFGCWLSRDPIEEEGGDNLNGFLANQPVNNVDFLGLKDCCGPDITNSLREVLAKVRNTFRLWSREKQVAALRFISKDPDPSSAYTIDGVTHIPPANLNGWDIEDLAKWKNLDWLSQEPYDGCATGKCKDTVLVDGKCFYAGSVNYVVFGAMMRLLHNAFPGGHNAEVIPANRFTMNLLISAYKGEIAQVISNGNAILNDLPHKKVRAANYETSRAWANAGYDKWPIMGTPPEEAAYSDCPPCGKTCSKAFTVSWFPNGQF